MYILDDEAKVIYEILTNYYSKSNIKQTRFNCRKKQINEIINRTKSRLKVNIDEDVSNNYDSKIFFKYVNLIRDCRGYANLVKKRNLAVSSETIELMEELGDHLIEKLSYLEYGVLKSYFSDNFDRIPKVREVLLFGKSEEKYCRNGMTWFIDNLYIEEYARIEMLKKLTKKPAENYPLARSMKRHFIIHAGETNSGKTFESIEALKKSESGVYLAPLRLLALEIQENLNLSEVPCSLITGEERDLKRRSTHISSTIEMLDTDEEYDVAVIDECQLLNNPQRGWAWTRAILGTAAKEIHICTAPEAVNIIIRLIEHCGDTYSIKLHKRDTELRFIDRNYDIEKDIKAGDALIVFSKSKVLAVASELQDRGINASVIYGSLPYSTRKKQFQRFLDKETDVIVSTDAIGMGVNLPIKRVVFLEDEKYDGLQKRHLYISEIKQIAGRAGRRGIYDIGYVQGLHRIGELNYALNSNVPDIKRANIIYNDQVTEVDGSLINLLKAWSSQEEDGDLFNKTDVTRRIQLLTTLKRNNIKSDNKTLLKMATVAFDEKRKQVKEQWLEYCKMHTKGAINLLSPEYIKKYKGNSKLDNLEDYYKKIDLYYSFARCFSIPIREDWVIEEKEKITDEINYLLINNINDYVRYCPECGKKMKWYDTDYLCEECMEDKNSEEENKEGIY